jgi:hypothetical protein
MSKKGQARNDRDTANLRDFLREKHRNIHDLVIEEATKNFRSYHQQIAYVLAGWASVHAEDLDKAITHVDKWLDGMVSPDEGEADGS